jgi:hypothetical protein
MTKCCYNPSGRVAVAIWVGRSGHRQVERIIVKELKDAVHYFMATGADEA